MTVIAAKGVALNMSSFDLSGALDYAFSDVGANLARYFDDADNYLQLTGSNMAFDPNNVPISGTVTGTSTVDAGVEILRMSGFSIQVPDVITYIQTNDAAGLWTAILGGNDTIKGTSLADVLLGNRGNDLIYGNGGNDILRGEAGSDRLLGGTGRDVLNGGIGNDQLNGEAGSDTLIGGLGSDSFIFKTAPSAANIDTIQDFNVVADQIMLAASVFAEIGLAGTTLAAPRFHIGAQAHDLSDRIIYNSATGALYYDEDGSDDGIAAVQIAKLGAGLALTELDFRII